MKPCPNNSVGGYSVSFTEGRRPDTTIALISDTIYEIVQSADGFEFNARDANPNGLAAWRARLFHDMSREQAGMLYSKPGDSIRITFPGYSKVVLHCPSVTCNTASDNRLAQGVTFPTSTTISIDGVGVPDEQHRKIDRVTTLIDGGGGSAYRRIKTNAFEWPKYCWPSAPTASEYRKSWEKVKRNEGETTKECKVRLSSGV